MAQLKANSRIWGNAIVDSALTINGGNAASSFSTGALIITNGGGLGINGAAYIAAGIQNTPIGNVTAATGGFTTVTAAGLTCTTFGSNSTGTVSGAWTYNSTLTAASTLSLTGATTTVTSLGTSATTGTLSLGGTLQTGNVTLGQTTANATIGLHIGQSTANVTKVLNIGTGGLATSNTTITIGPTLGYGTATFATNTNVIVSNSLSVTGTVTGTGATNATAFIAGNSAVNNVALAFMPTVGTAAQMAIRDFSTPNSVMYFDTTVGSGNIGGSFQFRGSNLFTQYAQIDRFGVTTPTLPAYRVYGNTSTNYTAGTTIVNQAVDYNQGSYYNNATGIFTAPTAGLYHAFATVRVGSNNGLNQASIQKNSSNSGANVVAFWETDTNTGTATHFSMTGYAKLAVGDTLRLQVVTGNVQFDANDSWGVTFIG